MIFKEIIDPANIYVLEQTFEHKEELLSYLLEKCLKGTAMESETDAIRITLLEREESMSTGIGLGVAVPHCSSDRVQEPMGLFALLKQPIEFEAVDEQPVQILVLILMPRKKYDRHISILAAIARLFNNAAVRNAVLAASTPEEILEIVQANSEKQ